MQLNKKKLFFISRTLDCGYGHRDYGPLTTNSRDFIYVSSRSCFRFSCFSLFNIFPLSDELTSRHRRINGCNVSQGVGQEKLLSSSSFRSRLCNCKMLRDMRAIICTHVTIQPQLIKRNSILMRQEIHWILNFGERFFSSLLSGRKMTFN